MIHIQDFLKTNINDLKQEYTLDESLFSDLDERLYDLKNKITEPEWIVLILYAELNSYREVGKILNISHSSVRKFIRKIRKKLC